MKAAMEHLNRSPSSRVDMHIAMLLYASQCYGEDIHHRNKMFLLRKRPRRLLEGDSDT